MSGAPNVFAIDFGLSRRFKTKEGEVKEPRAYAGFRGTARYASLNSHQSLELSRRDDLWSLFYMMVEFLTGSLPWKKEKDREQIGKLKEEHTNPTLVQGLPQQMLTLLHHISKLSYREKPNYEFIRTLFRQMLFQTKENPVPFFLQELRCTNPLIVREHLSLFPSLSPLADFLVFTVKVPPGARSRND